MKSKKNYEISFQERSKLAKEILSNQSPTTLKKAKKQVEMLKKGSLQSKKK